MKVTALSREIQSLKSQSPSKWSFSSLRSSGSDQKQRDRDLIQTTITQKEQELISLKSIKGQSEAIISIFNSPQQQDPASLVRPVFDENSTPTPSKPAVIICDLSIPHQTKIDLDRGYTLTIQGRALGQEAAIEELIKQVGPETAKKIVCITNQQLAISLVPIDTRNPEIYNALKAQSLRPVAANEFPPLFKVDVAPDGITITVQTPIWVKNRDTEQNVTLITATCTIFNAERLPMSPVRLEYSLY